MISPSAHRAFNSILTRSLHEILDVENSKYQWKVSPIHSPEHIKAREFSILTMCSYTFRLFATLHFTFNSATRQFTAEALNIPIEKVDKEAFHDYMGELGNRYTGAIKRELQATFPHLGMSTPVILKKRSFVYLSQLKFEESFQAHAVGASKVGLFFGLFVCPYGELNFQDAGQQDDVETGTVELL